MRGRWRSVYFWFFASCNQYRDLVAGYVVYGDLYAGKVTDVYPYEPIRWVVAWYPFGPDV